MSIQDIMGNPFTERHIPWRYFTERHIPWRYLKSRNKSQESLEQEGEDIWAYRKLARAVVLMGIRDAIEVKKIDSSRMAKGSLQKIKADSVNWITSASRETGSLYYYLEMLFSDFDLGEVQKNILTQILIEKVRKRLGLPEAHRFYI